MSRRPWLWGGGITVALCLIVIFQEVGPVAVAIVFPVLAVFHLTIRSNFGRLDDAERHVAEMNRLYTSTIETLAMAIDAKLLVLDEPTLGLDLLYRKQFYDALLNEYFDGRRTILVTTHQVEEIQDILTDLIFIQHGRIVLDSTMDALEARYAEVMVRPEQTDAARALKPLRERRVFGRSVMLFDNVPREQLQQLGELRTPSIAELFVATMEESQTRQEVIQ